MPDSGRRRAQQARRRRVENETHRDLQGESAEIMPRSCKHKFSIGRGCEECKKYVAARKEKGLGGNPYRIPY